MAGSGAEPHVEAEADSDRLPRVSLHLWHSGNGAHPEGRTLSGTSS